MIKDEQYEKTEGKEVIEVLVESDKVGVWVPVAGTDLRIMGKDYELRKVKAIHVRKL